MLRNFIPQICSCSLSQYTQHSILEGTCVLLAAPFLCRLHLETVNGHLVTSFLFLFVLFLVLLVLLSLSLSEWPRYNHTGWLGLKQQVTNLLLSEWLCCRVQLKVVLKFWASWGGRILSSRVALSGVVAQDYMYEDAVRYSLMACFSTLLCSTIQMCSKFHVATEEGGCGLKMLMSGTASAKTWHNNNVNSEFKYLQNVHRIQLCNTLKGRRNTF